MLKNYPDKPLISLRREIQHILSKSIFKKRAQGEVSF